MEMQFLLSLGFVLTLGVGTILIDHEWLSYLGTDGKYEYVSRIVFALFNLAVIWLLIVGMTHALSILLSSVFLWFEPSIEKSIFVAMWWFWGSVVGALYLALFRPEQSAEKVEETV